MRLFHQCLWGIFAFIIFVAGVCMAGYADYNKHEAHADGRQEVIMTLPVETLARLPIIPERDL